VIVGDRKMAVFDDTKPWEDKLLLYAHKIKWQNNLPIPYKAEPERLDIFQNEPLRVECQHFIECISNGEQPITDGREGVRVLKVLNASQRSLDQNGKTIYLSKPDNNAETLSTAKPRGRSNELINDDKNDFFTHPSAFIDDGSQIGSETKIWHFSHILSGSTIGKNCNIGQNVVVGPDVRIGDGCKIQNNISIYKGVTLEDHVFCGPSMVFTNVYNPRAEIIKMDQVRPTIVKKGATIGANATIVCGHTIGRYAFIGAGAVVIKNVHDHAMVVGNPAIRIGWVCECGERLSDELKCLKCNAQFEQKEKGSVVKIL